MLSPFKVSILFSRYNANRSAASTVTTLPVSLNAPDQIYSASNKPKVPAIKVRESLCQGIVSLTVMLMVSNGNTLITKSQVAVLPALSIAS